MNPEMAFYVVGFFAVMNFGALVSVGLAGFKLAAKFGDLSARVDRNAKDIQNIFSMK